MHLNANKFVPRNVHVYLGKYWETRVYTFNSHVPSELVTTALVYFPDTNTNENCKFLRYTV